MLFASVLIMVFVGCACNRQNSMEEALDNYVAETEADISDFRAILFLPLEGCGSCIQHGIEFYKENADNTEILFVFCTYKPYGYDFLKDNNRGNVIIDKKNIAIKNQILTTAPVLYKHNGERFVCLGTATGDFDFNVIYH